MTILCLIHSLYMHFSNYQFCLQLAYLPYKRRDLISDDENTDLHVNLEGNAETADDSFKEEKKRKKHGLLNWLKIWVRCPLIPV